MTTYVFNPDTGRMVDKDTGAPMNPPDQAWKPVTPMTFGDIEPYQSPIDGAYVGGRRGKRYDLAKNDCIDARELPPVTDGKFRNKRFVEKRGLQALAHESIKE